MNRITGIHGIGNYHYMARTGSVTAAVDEISSDWTGALNLGLADVGLLRPADLRVAYYAHLLRRGTPQGELDPANLDGDAQDLLISFVGQLFPPAALPVPQGERTAQARAAADWLTRHFGSHVYRLVLVFCREVSTYLSDLERRQTVRDTVAESIASYHPQIIIAHSLGSVVAYETLWQYPELNVNVLLTLGSPLAMPRVVFERLDPKPHNGRGARPPGVTTWANLADAGDIVAIPHIGLTSHFEGLDYDDPSIVIGDHAFHSIQNYLSARATVEFLRLVSSGLMPN